MRRFDIGPLIVAVGSLVLLVSLFLDWYGRQSAWGVFEVADVLLAALALGALVTALGMITDEIAVLDRRWLLGLVLAATVLVIAELISPPPVVGGADPQEGAWLAFAASLVMLLGTVLSLGRVSFSFAIEGREPHRVAAVDHRPPPTDTGSVVARPGAAEPRADAPEPRAAASEPRAAASEPRAGEDTTATEVLPEEGGKKR